MNSGDPIRDAIVDMRRRNRARADRVFGPSRSPGAGEPGAEPDPTDPAELRRLIASERGVPPTAVDRLRGDTREEVEADCDALLQTVAPVAPYLIPRPEPPEPIPDMGGGVRGAVPAAPDDVEGFMQDAVRDTFASRSLRHQP